MSSSTSGGACGPCNQDQNSDDPVRFADGEVILDENDLSGKAFGFSWGHTRSYGNQLSRNNTGFNGNSWLVPEVEYLVSLQPDLVAVMRGMNTIVWLRKSGDIWRADLGYKLTMRAVGGDWQVYNQSTGLTQLFYGEGAAWYLRGQLKQVTNAAGNVASISRDGQGRINKWEATDGSATPAKALRFDYTYYAIGSGSGLLNQVTKVSTIDGIEKNVRRATYAYYGIADANGNFRDLKSAVVEQWSGSAWVSIRKSCYRYYLPSSPDGFTHGLKFVMGPESVRRMTAAGVDPDTAPDNNTGATLGVAGFADKYFRYDSGKRVTMERVDGGSREFTFTYSDNPFPGGYYEGYNFWKTKTIHTLPDGSRQLIYTNYMLLPILKVYQGDGKEWYEYWRYDDGGRTVLVGSSQSVAGYDESVPTLVALKADEGLISVSRYYDFTDTHGGAEGFLHYSAVKRGEHGDEIRQNEYEYVAQANGDQTIFKTSKSTVYNGNTATAATDPAVTTRGYSWYTGTLQVKMLTTTLPVIDAAQHGDSDSYSTDEFYDAYSYNTWSRNELGVITRRLYDKGLGVISQLIQDVQTSGMTDVPSGWMTLPENGLNLVTDYQYDMDGRQTQQLGPVHNIALPPSSGGTPVNTAVRTANYTVYRDDIDEVWTARGYASGSAPGYNYVTMNPIAIARTNAAGKPTDQILAERDGPGRLSSSDNFPQEKWLSWTSMSYDNSQRLAWQRSYFAIPTSQGDAGVNGTNFNQRDYGYDSMARTNRERSGGGTITRTVFNARAQLISTWQGTNDTGATDSDPTGGGAVGNNMVEISFNFYDYAGTPAYQAHGNGLLTQQTKYAAAGDLRVTQLTYDWRDRKISTQGEERYFKSTAYNNRSRAIQVERRDADAMGTLLTRNTTAYDPLGRVYQKQTIAIAAGNPTGNVVESNKWYDGAGHTIKSQSPGRDAVMKICYDSLGRQITTFLCYSEDGVNDGDTNDVSADIVIEQNEIQYDSAFNVTGTIRLFRFHDATGTGPLNGPTGSQPKSRNYYNFIWPDGIGRTTATANYGTYGGSQPTRPPTAPDSSASIFVRTLDYNLAGKVFSSVNPQNITTRTAYDSLGRTVKVIENFTGGTPDGSSNRTTQYAYNADSLLEMLTLQNSATGAQITRWQYGTALSNSQVASSKLLRAKIYPDSDDAANPLSNGDDGIYDRIEYAYNRLGQVNASKDQNGTEHAFIYDKRGRQTADQVTTLGGSVDGAVRRIQTAYDNLNLTTLVTSYDATASGNVVNQVAKSYNSFGQLASDAQAHSGGVTTTTTSVAYRHADGSDNSTRLTDTIYPNGRILQLGYGFTGSIDSALSRLATVTDATTSSPWEIAAYSYLGADTAVISAYLEPEVQLTYISNDTAGDPYTGLDSFGRNIDHRWIKSDTDIERLEYGYNQASLRQWQLDMLAHAADKKQDNYYQYDGLGQVTTRDQGQLVIPGCGGINGTPIEEEEWAFDSSGNWNSYQRKANGTTTFDQTRTHNKVNEIKTYDASGIPIVFDPCGNMTRIPRQSTGTTYYEATWDAWNRLVRLKTPDSSGGYGSYSGGNLDVKYAYDGQSRRITKQILIGPQPGTTHFYYNEQWKCIEERQGGATTASQQYIFGARGRNDLIFRDQFTPTFVRHYALCDNMGSKVAITDANGSVLERYAFTAFGDLGSVMASDYTPRPASLYQWETLFHGEVRDAETGYYNYGYRYYLPRLGRWPSRDPIGESGGVNLYKFVRNDGINYADLIGLIAIPVPNSGSLLGGLGGVGTAIGNGLAAFGTAIADGLSVAGELVISPVGALSLALTGTASNSAELDFEATCPRVDAQTEKKKCQLTLQYNGPDIVSNSVLCTYDCDGEEKYLALAPGETCDDEVDEDVPD